MVSWLYVVLPSWALHGSFQAGRSGLCVAGCPCGPRLLSAGRKQAEHRRGHEESALCSQGGTTGGHLNTEIGHVADSTEPQKGDLNASRPMERSPTEPGLGQGGVERGRAGCWRVAGAARGGDVLRKSRNRTAYGHGQVLSLVNPE
ncbi:hypothetical protein GN956_G18637 [Arapaima gigas]